VIDPDLAAILAGQAPRAPRYESSRIIRRDAWVEMRDGVRLATDVYLPPGDRLPTVVMRTPYGRRKRQQSAGSHQLPDRDQFAPLLAQHGYAVVSQDVRATGESESDEWHMYIYEREDGYDTVEWVTRQSWYDGTILGAGASYLGMTQWCMALHPRMTAIAPEVAGMGDGTSKGVGLHMFVKAYARSVGKGPGKVPIAHYDMERRMLEETLASGYFNSPLEREMPDALLARFPRLRSRPRHEQQRTLWRRYAAAPPAERVEMLALARPRNLRTVFGPAAPVGLHIYATPSASALYRAIRAPALMVSGWYDWGLELTLQSWTLLQKFGRADVRARSTLLITPTAHNAAGYREGLETNTALRRTYRASENVELLLRWYEQRSAHGADSDVLPRVVFFLMGANEWRRSPTWPPPGVRTKRLYLAKGGGLTTALPRTSGADAYVYDPRDPTPTVAGSIVSSVLVPGSGDVSEAQRRSDVLVYTTPPLTRAVDVVGPLRVVLFATSSALDTDFVARLSDVFPDGRALQLQNGIVRARYRGRGDPRLLTPGKIYRFDIDLWATANRFAAGHHIRLDISSADFPRFERNSNLGGRTGEPIAARQTIYRGRQFPSHVVLPILEGSLDL